MKIEFGKTLIEKRFGSTKKVVCSVEKKIKKEKKLELSKNIKQMVNKDSITEYNGADKLNEILEINERNISNDQKFCINNLVEINTNFDIKKSIPPRIPYTGLNKEEYKTLEVYVFNMWKKINYNLIFERNIEIWRQFWITCERSDVIIQIIDARNPDFFINKDLIELYPNKKHVIFANKSDLVYDKNLLMVNYAEMSVVNYSSKTNIKPVLDFLNDTSFKSFGFIGYPNVGKSSTINAILNRKKVKVSQTPGKTKYIQTIEFTDNKILLDCPGLVFPKHSKTYLLLNGILNVDKVIDLRSSLYEVIRYIGIDVLCSYYKIENIYKNEVEFINGLSTSKGISVLGCIKNIVKDLFNGNIQYLRISK